MPQVGTEANLGIQNQQELFSTISVTSEMQNLVGQIRSHFF